jgi:ABC-type proline/glycine betaine transport system substrate-binding protein
VLLLRLWFSNTPFSFSFSVPDDAPVVVLDQVSWASARLNNWVAKILLEEVLGERVEFDTNPRPEIYDWEGLSNGTVTATLEVWADNLEDIIDYYTLDLRTVESVGPLGRWGAVSGLRAVEVHSLPVC